MNYTFNNGAQMDRLAILEVLNKIATRHVDAKDREKVGLEAIDDIVLTFLSNEADINMVRSSGELRELFTKHLTHILQNNIERSPGPHTSEEDRKMYERSLRSLHLIGRDGIELKVNDGNLEVHINGKLAGSVPVPEEVNVDTAIMTLNGQAIKNNGQEWANNVVRRGGSRTGGVAPGQLRIAPGTSVGNSVA